MERVSKHNYYLDIAETVSERSTCLRRRYGAIIVKNDVIISTGYNGAPRGRANCSDTGSCTRERLGIPRGEDDAVRAARLARARKDARRGIELHARRQPLRGKRHRTRAAHGQAEDDRRAGPYAEDARIVEARCLRRGCGRQTAETGRHQSRDR